MKNIIYDAITKSTTEVEVPDEGYQETETPPQPTETELLTIRLAEQNQLMSDLMDILFTTVPELIEL